MILQENTALDFTVIKQRLEKVKLQKKQLILQNPEIYGWIALCNQQWYLEENATDANLKDLVQNKKDKVEETKYCIKVYKMKYPLVMLYDAICKEELYLNGLLN
ncbi:MAG: hypothetical protein RR290_01895 [Clostridia bacterium]